jgi:hypothetical protein
LHVQEVIIHLPKFIVYSNHILRPSAWSDVSKLENPTILNGQLTTSEFAEASEDENTVITGGSFHMGKATGGEGHDTHSSGMEIKNAWIFS